MTNTQWNERLKTFFKQCWWNEVLQLATDYPSQRNIIINFDDFYVFDEELANELIKHPDEIILLAQRALCQIDLPIEKSIGEVNVQFTNIPHQIAIRDVRIKHISKFIAVKGFVRKVTKIHPMITNAAFSCAHCNHVAFVPQTSRQLVEPSECDNKKCGWKGTLNILIDKSTFINTHKLQIQELPENVKNGAQPQNIDVYVENCIVGSTTPGTRVVINGILRSSQRNLQKGKSKFYDLVLHANSIEYANNELAELDISPEDEKKILEMSRDPQIYTNISKTIAPSICGHEDIKEAITLQLFSGVSKCLPDKSKVRGDIHILLVGEPDIGKSQLLKSVIELVPNGKFISGENPPSENLAFTITESDFGDTSWILEAGSLVMADKGIAAVDDMNEFSLENQNRLHEAMENQTININNANITNELKSRCALLAVTNLKYGRLDPYEEIVQQINIRPKILSSFDLIFVLQDIPNIDTDLKVADHIFDSQCFGEQVNQHKNGSDSDNIQDQTSSQIDVIQPIIDPIFIRKYVAYAKNNIFPIIDDEARKHLTNFYMTLREMGGDKTPIPITADKLKTLVRLTEASARVRLSNNATLDDAIRATQFVLSFLKQIGTDPHTGAFDADIIVCGTSQSQRERINVLKNIIRTIADGYFNGKAPLEEIYNRAEDEYINREDAKELIAQMKSVGDILKLDNTVMLIE